MAAGGVEKLSVSVPRELARSVRKRAGPRGVSSFVARALQRELERAQLADFVVELEERLGPVPDDLLDEARKAWSGKKR